MKMSDTFDLPVNGVAHHVSIEQNEAAAHAINYHDELVAALEYCLGSLGNEFALPSDCIDEVESVLAKARGEL
jgi:hypothetical protein